MLGVWEREGRGLGSGGWVSGREGGGAKLPKRQGEGSLIIHDCHLTLTLFIFPKLVFMLPLKQLNRQLIACSLFLFMHEMEIYSYSAVISHAQGFFCG